MAHRRTFTVKEKAEIISKLKNGENNADLCKEYKVSHSTISTMWKNRDEILECFESKSLKIKRNRKPTHQDVENALLMWFKTQRSQNVPLSGRLLQEKANHFARLLGKIDFDCSESWIYRFRQRHDIVLGKVCGETASVSQSDCDDWLKTNPKLAEGYTDSQIWNADETDGLLSPETFRLKKPNKINIRKSFSRQASVKKLLSSTKSGNIVIDPTSVTGTVHIKVEPEESGAAGQAGPPRGAGGAAVKVELFEVDESGSTCDQRDDDGVVSYFNSLRNEKGDSNNDALEPDMRHVLKHTCQHYKCSSCGGSIVGFRYACVQCADYDQCAECEASGAHAEHYVLRVPRVERAAEFQTVLDRVRRELVQVNIPVQIKLQKDEEEVGEEEILVLKTETVELKEEVDPLHCAGAGGGAVKQEHKDNLEVNLEALPPEVVIPSRTPTRISEPSNSNSRIPGASSLPTVVPDTYINTTTRLYKILNQDCDGKNIISIYENKRALIQKARNRLTRFIIKYECDKAAAELRPGQKLNNFIIPTERFDFWSNQIALTFRGERADTYFTQYKSVGDFEINPTGKLWNHYNYIKSKLRESDSLQHSRRPVNASKPTACTVEKLDVLRTKVDPWCEVLQLWKETHAARRNFLKNKKPTVNQYLDAYACLHVQQAVDLFESDFLQLFPGKETLLANNWEKSKNFMISKLREAKISDAADNDLLHIISTVNSTAQDTIILHLLPYLISSGPTVRKRKRRSRNSTNHQDEENSISFVDIDEPEVVSRAETTNESKKRKPRVNQQERRDSFLLHIEDVITLEEILNRTNQRRVASPVHQPIPVIVGELLKPAAIYVVVGNRAYSTESALTAVDLAFKMYRALDCQYPVNGTSLWTFIQKGLFVIDLKGDIVSCSLSELLGELQTIINSTD